MKRPQLIIHGGAITDTQSNSDAAMQFLRQCCAAAFTRLLDGADARSTVQIAVREMELSGLFLAGKGAHPNQLGQFELDASIMNGRDGTCGSVANAVWARCAIDLAEHVRAEGRSVLLAGDGIRAAFPNDISWLLEEEDYFRPVTLSPAAKLSGLSTVGAVAADTQGHCAAATATGGLVGKRACRVGDSALIGAGTWADARVAISCSGQGEYFIRTAAARSASARIAFGAQDPATALDATVAEIGALAGVGGMIAATPDEVCFCFNTAGLRRAWVDAEGGVQVDC